jgi:hypothetical protein
MTLTRFQMSENEKKEDASSDVVQDGETPPQGNRVRPKRARHAERERNDDATEGAASTHTLPGAPPVPGSSEPGSEGSGGESSDLDGIGSDEAQGILKAMIRAFVKKRDGETPPSKVKGPEGRSRRVRPRVKTEAPAAGSETDQESGRDSSVERHESRKAVGRGRIASAEMLSLKDSLMFSGVKEGDAAVCQAWDRGCLAKFRAWCKLEEEFLNLCRRTHVLGEEIARSVLAWCEEKNGMWLAASKSTRPALEPHQGSEWQGKATQIGKSVVVRAWANQAYPIVQRMLGTRAGEFASSVLDCCCATKIAALMCLAQRALLPQEAKDYIQLLREVETGAVQLFNQSVHQNVFQAWKQWEKIADFAEKRTGCARLHTGEGLRASIRDVAPLLDDEEKFRLLEHFSKEELTGEVPTLRAIKVARAALNEYMLCARKPASGSNQQGQDGQKSKATVAMTKAEGVGDGKYLPRGGCRKLFKVGKCAQGDACKFAHSGFTPGIGETILCPGLVKNKKCDYGSRCCYKHEGEAVSSKTEAPVAEGSGAAAGSYHTSAPPSEGSVAAEETGTKAEGADRGGQIGKAGLSAQG